MHRLLSFLQNETGQDLIEYTLLIAFVALASAALFMGAGWNVFGIWDEGSEALSKANKSVKG